MAAAFYIDTRADAYRRTLVLRGEMDMDAAPQLAQALEQASAEGAREVVLDLAGLNFIDSTGLQALLVGRGFCAERQCRFFLSPRLPSHVRRLFTLTGVEEQFAFVADSAARGL